MKQFYKLLLLSFLIPVCSRAQSNYKAGSIVNAKGDTVRGFIDYREWDSSPETINFKNTLTGPHYKFSANDISFFSVNGLESYQRYNGPVSMDETNTSRLSGRDTSFRIATVFLKVLQKGRNITLYSFVDEHKTRFYISEPSGSKPVELIYRVYDGPANAQGGSTVTENTYQKQLFSIALKYNALDDNLSRKFEKSEYNAADLLVIVGRINNISPEETTRKTGPSGFSFFGGVGVNSATISPTANGGYQASGGTSHTSILPRGVIGLNVFVNPNTQRLIFRGELSVNPAKFQASYTNKVYPYILIDYSYNQLAISFSPQVIYNVYNAANLKFFVGAGLDINFDQYTNKVFKAHNAFNGVITNADPFNFSTTSNQVMLKAGTVISKKFEIFASYSTPVRITEDYYFQEDESNIHLGLNYIF